MSFSSLVCIGAGPMSLGIAVDVLEASTLKGVICYSCSSVPQFRGQSHAILGGTIV